MRWVKKGLVFDAAGSRPWAASHTALPVAETAGEALRIYYGTRDARNRSHIGSLETRLGPGEPLIVGEEPVLGPGILGAFDDSGASPSCLVSSGNTKYLYYTGWSLGVTVPFYLQVGLAVCDDGGRHFRRFSPAPLFERSAVDPYLTASPWVMRESGTWRMWYVSGTGWELHEGRPRHRYHIRYAESPDGLRWDRAGVVCIDYGSPYEYAFGRPCVLRDGSLYRMWYCYRGEHYRIGYAESADGVSWRRRDELAGIDVSPSGWDSEMVAYPMVFDHGGARLMLYNGNDYGRTGVGLASLERE
jgi:hypothetical protein